MNMKLILRSVITVILCASAFFAQPLLCAGEDPAQTASIMDSIAKDMRSSVAATVKSCDEYVKGLVKDFDMAKAVFKDNPELRVNICENFKLTTSITTIVDAPWLAQKVTEATVKMMPEVKEFTAELADTFRDAFIGEYSFTSRMMKEWCDKKMDDYDRAKNKVSGWYHEIRDPITNINNLMHFRGIVRIDDEGQLSVYDPPQSEWEVENPPPVNKVDNQPYTDHTWMSKEFARKKKEDQEKTRSKDLAAQGGAGFGSMGGGGGSGRDICP